MTFNILPAMQNADYLESPPAISEEDDVRASRNFEIAGAYGDDAAVLATKCHGLTGIANFLGVAIGLIRSPTFRAIFPDSLNVGLSRR